MNYADIPPMVSRKCLIAADDGSVRISWEDIRGIDSYIAEQHEKALALTARVAELENAISAALAVAQAGLKAAPHQHSGKNLEGDFDAIVYRLSAALSPADNSKPRDA